MYVRHRLHLTIVVCPAFATATGPPVSASGCTIAPYGRCHLDLSAWLLGTAFVVKRTNSGLQFADCCSGAGQEPPPSADWCPPASGRLLRWPAALLRSRRAGNGLTLSQRQRLKCIQHLLLHAPLLLELPHRPGTAKRRRTRRRGTVTAHRWRRGTGRPRPGRPSPGWSAHRRTHPAHRRWPCPGWSAHRRWPSPGWSAHRRTHPTHRRRPCPGWSHRRTHPTHWRRPCPGWSIHRRPHPTHRRRPCPGWPAHRRPHATHRRRSSRPTHWRRRSPRSTHRRPPDTPAPKRRRRPPCTRRPSPILHLPPTNAPAPARRPTYNTQRNTTRQ
jgi:hypothetical protein